MTNAPPCLGWILALLSAAMPVSSQPLPGQLIIDPEHPQWLMRAGGKHVFIAGPGDPEDFLYRGTRLPDGTRNGDQDALLDELIAEGGNCLYLQVVRSHGGDGPADHNPFVSSNPALGLDDDILDQWETWFDRMEAEHILIYLFFYDDSALVWSTGNSVGAAEASFVRGIVDRFEHHGNLIWIVAEESEEALSATRVRNIATVIASADEHAHIIGNHHHPGTGFPAWQPGSELDHYSMQLDVAPGALHAAALQAVAAGGSGSKYQVMLSEAAHVNGAPPAVVRDALWDAAMAGVMSMVYGIDIMQDTSVLNACRDLQQFFEATDAYRMTNRDELAFAGTDWVLADPPDGYIAYARQDDGPLGIQGLAGGRHDLLWVDGDDGSSATQTDVMVTAGDATFTRPAGIGPRCAVWVRRNDGWQELGGGTSGVAGVPELVMSGPLTPQSTVSLDLSDAASNALGYVFISFSSTPASFLGGTLHTFPYDELAVVATDSVGKLNGSLSFPGGPAGASLWFQVGVADATVPFHEAVLSHAVRGTIP